MGERWIVTPAKLLTLAFLVAKRKATLALPLWAISQQKMHYHSKSQQRDWSIALLSYQSTHPQCPEACFSEFASAPPGSLTSQSFEKETEDS